MNDAFLIFKKYQLITEDNSPALSPLYQPPEKLPGSLFTLKSQKIPTDVIWLGTANNACRGAWSSVDPVSLSEIDERLQGAIEEVGPESGDQKQFLYDIPHYDMDDNEIHNFYPLECYLPRNAKEFLKILKTKGFVRYYDGEWFNVYCKDQKKCKLLAEEMLNAMDEWMPGGVDF